MAQEFDAEYHRMVADTLARMGLLNSQVIEQQDYELMIRDEKIRREKLGWLSSFRLGLQFLTVNQDFDNDVTRVGVLPTLGVSLQVDFERFFTTPSRIRSARHEKTIIHLEQQRLMEVRKNEITSLYYEYVLMSEKTSVRFTTLQTVRDQKSLIEERFRNGETDLETYLNVVNSVDNATEAFYETKIQAEKALALIEEELDINFRELFK
jgi:outer membrane protein TolC